jgi:ribose/xylose/arabinose/galactoside ABC-type transport system permease subunit
MTNNNAVRRVLRRTLATKELGIFLVLILLSIIINIINPVFLSFNNIVEILRNTSYTLIVALGATILCIAKGLDLSVGGVLALSGLVCSLCLFNGVPVPVSVLAGLLTGAVFGLINAVAAVRFRIPSMIASLGSMYMARGLVLVITKGKPVYPLPESFANFGDGRLFNIPYIIIIALLLSVAAHVVLTRTVYGRKIYAIGGNTETAKYAGINVALISASAYIISSAGAALSGILTAARFGSGQPNVGDGLEMTVLTAVVIGGVSMNGGSGTILGTVLGSLLINVLSTGMNLANVSAYWQRFCTGLIIIIAVGIDQYQRGKKKA